MNGSVNKTVAVGVGRLGLGLEVMQAGRPKAMKNVEIRGLYTDWSKGLEDGTCLVVLGNANSEETDLERLAKTLETRNKAVNLLGVVCRNSDDTTESRLEALLRAHGACIWITSEQPYTHTSKELKAVSAVAMLSDMLLEGGVMSLDLADYMQPGYVEYLSVVSSQELELAISKNERMKGKLQSAKTVVANMALGESDGLEVLEQMASYLEGMVSMETDLILGTELDEQYARNKQVFLLATDS